MPRAAKQLGIPYIHTEHSSSLVWGEQGPSRTGKRILRDITANVVVTTFVSDGLKDAVERMGAEGRFAVLSNPVDAGIFPPPASSAGTDETILTVGSLIPRKRIDLILEASSLSAKKFRNYNSQLSEMAPDR